MPLYEFYCADCHTIYTFFSPRIDTETRPACPKCARPALERQASVFAVSPKKNADEGDSDDLDAGQMERAMQVLEREAGTMNEDDPGAAARVMRELSKAAGLEMTPAMEEAMRRMEAGEDPEAVEAELGDALDGEGGDAPFLPGGRGPYAKKRLPPKKDETIYDL